MKNFSSQVAKVAAAAAIVSVAANGLGAARAADAPLIAFSQEGMENSWRTENTNSILSEAKKYGYNIVWVQADGDQSRQVAQVQNLLQRKPKVLIVEPAEQQAATPIAGLADKAGVPLIVADRALGVSPGTGEYKILITQDWRQVGEALGKAAVQVLTSRKGRPAGNIVELAGVIGSAPEVDMDAGFKSVISAYPGIKIIADQDGQNERGPGLSIMEDYLTAHPKGQIDLVWGQNDEMALGALKAIQNAGRDELLGAIITKDGEAQGIRAVAEGNFVTDCTNTPYFGPIIMPYVKDILAGTAVAVAPQKPFTCFSSVTPDDKKQVQDLIAEMTKDKMTYAPR